MPDNIRTLLFPKTFREMPHRRLILNLLRSLHILCFCILVGGIYFHQSNEILVIWVSGAVISGFAMFLIDLYGSCIALFEVRGVSVIIKILLLACVPLLGNNSQMLLLIVVIIFSSFVSHSTRRMRHKNFMPQSFQENFGLHSEYPRKRKST